MTYNTSTQLRLGTHYPYLRAVFTAREHGCHFGQALFMTRASPCILKAANNYDDIITNSPS